MSRIEKKIEIVLELGIKRESGWIYFIDKDGDVCKGRIGGIKSYNPLKYSDPIKVKKVGLKRESGYLYILSDEGNIIRFPDDKNSRDE